VTVPVTAAIGANYVNSLAAGALQTGNGNNAAPAIATLTVVAQHAGGAPTLGKAFAPATINAGGVSLLTITLSNCGGTVLGLTKPLTDTLPTGMLVSGSATTTCGGSVTAAGSTVTLASGAIPANGSCTVSVPVTAANGGSFVNSLPAGALQTGSGGNASPAIATLTVSSPSTVSLGKTFSPAAVETGAKSELTITLSNTGATAAKLTAPLTDVLPTGLVIAGNGCTTCVGGQVTASADGSKLVLKSGTIPANGSCTVTIPVSAAQPGNFVNSLLAGALQTNKGSNAAPTLATLTVTPIVKMLPPVLGKSFSPAAIKAGDMSTLTITLKNPNSAKISLTKALTDNLPKGMLLVGSATTTCVGGSLGSASISVMGGTVPTPTSGSSVSLTSGSIPALGSCTVTVKVTAKDKGAYCNTLPAGALQTNVGKNIAPATATLTVNQLPRPR
jgi:uncharacterized repeat protein (TIGR01451 family)